MCGIVGYIGDREVYPVLINGLKRLEYRGYDSAGISILNKKPLIYKCKGKVSDLEQYVKNKNLSGHLGIGHTRWATHGEPNDINAHPHSSENGKFILIHNGIIENYASLKDKLIQEGHEFRSETDTEVLVHLIEKYYNGHLTSERSGYEKNNNGRLMFAVKSALKDVKGSYAIVVIHSDEKDKSALVLFILIL